MEHLLQQMGHVTTEYQTKDPIDVLHILATKLPDTLSIRTTCQVNSAGQPTFYSCAVTLGYRSVYVASRCTLEGALQTACSMVYDELQSKQAKIERDGLVDSELKKILEIFDASGFSVISEDCSRIFPDFDYRHLFRVPGFCEFMGSSDKSYKAAFEGAAEQLKIAFYGDFHLKQVGARRCIRELDCEQQTPMMTMSVLELIGFESSPTTSGGDKQKESTPMPPPRDLLAAKVEADFKAPRLLLCDFMWIELINRFIQANRHDRTYSDVVQELIAAELIKYTEKDESYSAKGNGAALIVEDTPQFKTTARLANVSITSIEVTLEKSRDRTFLKVHSKLVHLVKVLLAIKQSYSPDRSSLELMYELSTESNDFSQLVRLYTRTHHLGPEPQEECQIKTASVSLFEHMFTYAAYADTLVEAQFAASSALFSYLKALAEYTVESVMATTFLSDFSFDLATTSGYHSAYAEWIGPVRDETLIQAIQTLKSEVVPPLRARTFDIGDAVAKLVPLGSLIWNFHEVYNSTATPMEIAEELIERCRSQLPLTSEFDAERQYYICRLESTELGLLMGVSTSSSDQARTKVLTQLFAMLHQYATLVSSFKLFRSPSRAPEHYLADYLLLNADLISMRSWPVNLNRFKTLITVESLHVSFQDSGNSKSESQARAFEQFVAFMDLFIDPIDNCIDINKPLHQETVSQLGPNAYCRPVPLPKKKQEESSADQLTTLAKTMVMMLRFEQMCKLEATGSRAAVITRLMAAFPEEIKMVTTREGTTNNRGESVRRYKSVITASQLGCFTHLSLVSRTEAHNGAFNALWNRLDQLSKLVRKVIKLNTTDMTTIDKVLETAKALVTTVVFPLQKTVKVCVTNIGKFVATGQTLDKAKLFAFGKLSFRIREAREEALEAISRSDNEKLEKFKVNAALADAATGEVVDSAMAARIKLVKDFMSVYFAFKPASTIVEEMIAKTAGTGFIQTKREPSPFSLEHADVTMNIVVSGVGEFFGCAKECHQAYEEAALNLFQFTKKLFDLLESFQIVYTPTKSATQILDELCQMANNKQLIHIRSTELTTTNKDSPPTLCLIELTRVRSFGRLGPNEEVAKQEAAISAVDYLKRLAQGVFGLPQL